MFLGIKDAMMDVFPGLKVTRKMIHQVKAKTLDVVTRPGGNQEFFSGNLFGTNYITFTDSDVKSIIVTIFGGDFDLIKTNLREVPDWRYMDKAPMDELNVVISYIVHLIYDSSDFNDKEKRSSAIVMHTLFGVKTMCWIVSDRLHWLASESVARMAYENASRRYLIKKLNSWYAVIERRAENLASSDGIHMAALESYGDSKAVSYYITDSVGSIGSLVSYFYNLTVIATNAKKGALITSMTSTDFDGESELAVKMLTATRCKRSIDSTISDKRSFVKIDMLDAIRAINPATSMKALRGMLSWMSDNRYGEYSSHIESMIQNTAIILSQSLSDRDYIKIPVKSKKNTLMFLKGKYGSSRSRSKSLYDLRESGDVIIKDSKVKISPSTVSSTRCSVFLYMTLIAME